MEDSKDGLQLSLEQRVEKLRPLLQVSLKKEVAFEAPVVTETVEGLSEDEWAEWGGLRKKPFPNDQEFVRMLEFAERHLALARERTRRIEAWVLEQQERVEQIRQQLHVSYDHYLRRVDAIFWGENDGNRHKRRRLG